jgi:hypothetical protein
MTTAKDKMDEAAKRISENTDQAKQIGAVYKFVLDGDGGQWQRKPRRATLLLRYLL